eukprot:scaffold21787_cov62-Phaeocystis_antarctica.AAC.4
MRRGCYSMSPGCSPTSPTPRQLRTRRTLTRGGRERTPSPKPNPSCAPEGLRREEGEVDHVTLGVELARGHRRHLARRAAVRQRAAALSRQRVAVAVPLAPFGAAPGSAGLDAAAAATLLGRGLRAEPLFEREARRLCARDQRPERSHLAAHRAQCLLERRCWHLLDPGARSNWRPGGADGREVPRMGEQPAAAGEERGKQDREADDEGGARGPRRHRSRSGTDASSARKTSVPGKQPQTSGRMHSKPQPWRRVALIYFRRCTPP